MSKQIEKLRSHKVSEINGHNVYYDHVNYFVVINGMRMVVEFNETNNKN